jgi:two-component system cell cycle sensor histidine kinase PleC
MDPAALPTENERTAINRRRAERRRAVRNVVREERERLNSPSGRLAFDRELCLAFARNHISAAYAIPLLVAIIGVAAVLWTDPTVVLAWAATVLAAHVAMLVLCRIYVEAPANVSSNQWTNRFAAAELIGGAAWAALFILLPRTSGDVAGLEVFQFATMLIVVSVVTTLASPIPPAAATGTLPVVFALIAVYVSRGGLLFYVLAAVAAAAQGFFLVLASRLHAATLDALESRAEKDLLIVELETAKSISDESRRRAEEANLAKSRFLATMSHELRTPLNAILGFSEIMKGEVLGPVGNASYKDYLIDIHASGEHLLNLINEILDLSRIEAGRYTLSEEPVNLAAVAEECVRLVQVRAAGKKIAIIEKYATDLPRIWADDRAVRQIILNLLSNAIKFTPQGGEVIVRVGWASGGRQFLSIKDNGPGIPAEEIPIVLSAFGQGSIAIKSAERGAGLGLPIVQALMRTHDGTFDLHSKLREGTEAIATFPQTRVMEPLAPIAEQPRRSWLRAG